MCETNPNPGRIKIYTSGCPKNQKRCWKRIGSPPPAGSKKDVLKLRSSNSIVIAPAKTGSDNKSRIVVNKTDQTNKFNRSKVIAAGRMLKIVHRKLIEPKIDETPARCRLKIDKSTARPEWAIFLLNGG